MREAEFLWSFRVFEVGAIFGLRDAFEVLEVNLQAVTDRLALRSPVCTRSSPPSAVEISPL